jgi:hypothetical protein
MEARMADLREVFDMVTKQTEPDRDSFRQQEDRQRRLSRSRKWGAIAVAAAIVAALVVLGMNIGTGKDGGQPGTETTAPAVPAGPPLGAMIVGLDGTVGERIPNIPWDANSGPEFSGGRIAFMTGDRVGVIGLDDGTGMRILTGPTNNADGDATHSLSWSPGGTKIAYVANNHIWVMNADGSGQYQLTHGPGGDFQPAWSEHDVIAYWHGPITGEDGGPPASEIYTIPVTGGTPTRITNDHTSSIAPAWSPDGDQIAYFHGSGSGGELWIVDADGGGNHRVPVGPDGGWAPAWSPDGQQIAYLTCCANSRANDGRPVLNVNVIDLASGDVTDVGVTVETDFNGPSWVGNHALLINRYD